MTIGIKFTNNFVSTLAGAITDVDVSLTLSAGAGARLPNYSVVDGEYEYMTIGNTANNLEIVKVTARAGDTLTIARGQDGTAAKNWSAGDQINSRPCAAAMYDALQVNVAKANAGVNDDITELQGLTTPLTIEQGGTGVDAIVDLPSALQLLFRSRVGKSAAYTVLTSDRGKFIDCTSGTWNLTLPDAATAGAGFVFAVRNSGSGVITINPSGANNIDGAGSLALAADQACVVMDGGSNWYTHGLSSALPSQTGNSGKYLTTNGTVPSWGALSITGIGTGSQTWQNVRASRDFATNYQNTTGAPIQVSVSEVSDTVGGGYVSAQLYVGENTGAYVKVANDPGGGAMSAIVPDGHYYKVVVGAVGVIDKVWAELR